MSKYQISIPLFNAILAGREEEIEDSELDDLHEEVLKKFDELGIGNHTVDGQLYTFEADNFEEAKEIQKKLQMMVDQQNAEFPKTPDWTKDCIDIFEVVEKKIKIKTQKL